MGEITSYKLSSSSYYQDINETIISSSTGSYREKNKKASLALIEHGTSNADEIQRQVLTEILSRSGHVEYLQMHGMQGRTDRETFKKIMPVVTYEDLYPYIQRIAMGDPSPILCSLPISDLITSSGGSTAKLIPTIKEELDQKPSQFSEINGRGLYFGINLDSMCNPNEDVAYTLRPNMAYFEFLPVISWRASMEYSEADIDDDQLLLDLVDVQLEKEYELVLTTFTGLYRYRMGHILQVTGFKNKAPQFKFVVRKDINVLCIDDDNKIEEVELQNAVTNATNHLIRCEHSLVDYTSYADTSTIPGHYVLFWEITHNSTNTNTNINANSNTNNHHDDPYYPNVNLPAAASVMVDCCQTIEESLNSHYRYNRAVVKSIGPLEIRVVKRGTFVDDLIMMPRCVKHPSIIDHLNSRVVSNHFSPPSAQNELMDPSCTGTQLVLKRERELYMCNYQL